MLLNKIKINRDVEIENKKIILYGNDDLIDSGYKLLIKRGFKVVDILRKKDIDKLRKYPGDYDILICSRNPMLDFRDLKKSNIKYRKHFLYDIFGSAQCQIDYKFIINNLCDIEEVYEMLKENISKEIFIEYINSKITGNCFNLCKYETYGQYIEKDVLNISKYNTICDCGAFDGQDSVKFNENSENKNLNIISLEPEYWNYKKILKLICDKNLTNVKVINIGAWNKKANLYFNSSNSSSKIDVKGNEIIKTDTIDNIFKDIKLDYLKLDVEGAELEVLQGAKDTIIKNETDIAVCIYHKKEDIFKIPLFIKELGIDYEYKLRIYNKYSIELVLYAIKK